MNHRYPSKTVTRIMALFLAASLIALTGFQSAPAAGRTMPNSAHFNRTPGGQIDPGDLETFADELITRQLDEYHIAGAALSIVQDGKIELAKGYGYADIEKQIPVTPDETIFRIGSTSKLLTWTAVMQLVEQGKIDLDADVNTYLTGFEIPDTFSEPVTMRNLMSHTAGFEERTVGIESPGPEEMISLHDYLATYMPDRVRPAGELISYSNYGAGLAGYIVEAVSGMPFEQYIETYIFEPLDMSNSTFRQPVPENLEGSFANSYSYNGGYQPGAFTYVNLRPAGAMSSTAQDMANFMIAQLQDGKFGATQILKPETAIQMHSHLFSDDERLDGMAYGFIEWNINGVRVLWHGGDIGNWHSGLGIIPEENLGFFVDYNSREGIPAVNEFYASFMDAFFHAKEATDPPPWQSSTQDVSDLAGEYRGTRSVYNHVERILFFPGNGSVRVKVNPDRTLSITGQTLYEKEPLVYSNIDNSDTVIFQQDGNGKIAHFFVNSNPLFAFERVSWYETSTFNLVLFGSCYLLLLSAFLAGIIGKFRRNKGSSVHRLPRLARLWALSLSVVFLLMPVAVITYSVRDVKHPFPVYMVVVLAIILAASLLVIGPVIFTTLAWARRFWSRAGRIHYTLVTVALLGMVWLMYYWRLLGFRY